METITQVLQQSRGCVVPQSSATSICTLSQTRQAEILGRWPNTQALTDAFSPNKQHEHYALGERCYTGTAPTLSEAKAVYGTRVDVAWVLIQLSYINELVGSKGKMTQLQLEATANDIANLYYHLKISELQIFFYQFRIGKYEQFYGSVDPQVILRSLKTFMLDRADALNRIDMERRRKEREEENKYAVSYEEYLRLKHNTK